MSDNMWGGLQVGQASEEELALNTLFPSKDRFQKLQMLGEWSPNQKLPMSVLGLLRRKFKSVTLKILQEEIMLNNIASDRLGRVEASEVLIRRLLPTTQEEK